MKNLHHSTPSAQRPNYQGAQPRPPWRLPVCLLLLWFTPVWLDAQVSPQIPPNMQAQLQVAQPAVDVSSPVTATSAFDPPVVRAGEKAFYRVNLDASEASIAWPEKIPVPAELKLGASARGQMTPLQGNKFRPLTALVYEVQTTATGRFTVTNFDVTAAGQPVAIPAASIEVVAENPNWPPARQLRLETSATNVFLGQPFHVRVLLPLGPGNEVEALREIQLNGNGLMIDKTASHQAITPVNLNGQLKPAFVCEMTVTPIATGPLKFSAQGFTAGREFSGPISIQGQINMPGGPTKYVLLLSEAVALNVRPLPTENERPGFTGTMGKFFYDPPALSTNRLRVGEPVQLKITFHGEGDLTRLVPPIPPHSSDWQIIADPPPAIGFTLIPLTDEVKMTPAIPFSYFNPETAQYVDLTIPPLPVTVTGDGLPVQLPALDDAPQSAEPLKLSGLAPAPGKTVTSLKPLQLRGWFVGVQLVPLLGLLALWQWDRQRRFLEAHPEIVRRRRARRALRRIRRPVQTAVASGNATAFVQLAADAMKIAVAPHYPAHPQALVCGDVLAQLGETERNSRIGGTVRTIFAAADTRFAVGAKSTAELLTLADDVEMTLQKLEEKL